MSTVVPTGASMSSALEGVIPAIIGGVGVTFGTALLGPLGAGAGALVAAATQKDEMVQKAIVVNGVMDTTTMLLTTGGE